MAVRVFVVAKLRPRFPLAAHSGRSGLSDARRFARSCSAGASATEKYPGGLSGIESGKMYSLSCTKRLPRRITTGVPFFKTLSRRRPSFGFAVETVKYSRDRYSVQKRTQLTMNLCEEGQGYRGSFFHGRLSGKSNTPFACEFSAALSRARPSKKRLFS